MIESKKTLLTLAAMAMIMGIPPKIRRADDADDTGDAAAGSCEKSVPSEDRTP